MKYYTLQRRDRKEASLHLRIFYFDFYEVQKSHQFECITSGASEGVYISSTHPPIGTESRGFQVLYQKSELKQYNTQQDVEVNLPKGQILEWLIASEMQKPKKQLMQKRIKYQLLKSVVRKRIQCTCDSPINKPRSCNPVLMAPYFRNPSIQSVHQRDLIILAGYLAYCFFMAYNSMRRNWY